MTARSTRAARGAGATAVAVILGSVSHTIGGGVAPSPLLMLAVAILAWPLATALMGTGARPSDTMRRFLRTIGLAASVLLAQLLLHVVFALVGTGTGTGGATTFGHVHGAPLLLPDPAPLTAAPSVDAAMLACHLAAAAIAFALLSRGEAVLTRIGAWVLAVASRALAGDARPRIGAGVTPGAPAALAPLVVALSSLSRRGPPRLSRGARAA
ncbi:hypothetical protein M4I32_11270 [Microbacterium sp. LRZ72]|uniref:hypothetical protein n=1 Tax=Microbacterium sp. LRZ72 TaxID=2942481 RepID=UPI0029B5B9B1|nr:hypothetical protein [Microbacterium sp. LRZ72]MDX2377379.1 hypothetical protein [Microbacterium sp. LRZ72]